MRKSKFFESYASAYSLIVTKGHTYLKPQICLSNMYDIRLPLHIKGFKLIYIDHNFECLHMQLFLHKVLHNQFNKILENSQILKGSFRCLCHLVIS